MRDSQRSAVYKWERSVIPGGFQANGNPLPLDDCRHLVQKISKDWGIPIPRVKDGRGTRIARGWRRWVNLPRWSRTQPIILHEMGHAIIDNFDHDYPWHGPRFATLLLVMWNKYLGVDVVEARRLGIQQRPRRVHFARLAEIPNPTKRTYQLI